MESIGSALAKESDLRAVTKERKFAWNVLKRLKTLMCWDYDNFLFF